MEITFTLNGSPSSVDVPPNTTLLHVLRENFDLTGAKPGCEAGTCGACTVLIDGAAEKACTFTVQNLEGRKVETIEGLCGPDDSPNDLQHAFMAHGAVQCGYCTPGMIMAGEALLAHNHAPSREEIRAAIADNLCRCTGYVQIVDAIEATAKQRISKQEAG